MTDSNSNIMSVAEMIENAFGEPDVNTVNHKLIQTILYILARQLRILERRVEIEIGVAVQPSSSSLSVTEVKVHAMQKKKKKATVSKTSGSAMGGGGRGGGSVMGMGGGGGGARGGGMGGGGMGGGGMGGGGMGGGGARGGGGGPGGGGMGVGGGKGGVGGGGAGKQGGKQSSSDKTSSEKTSTDKTSSDKTFSDKTQTDKSSSQKTSSDKTKSSSDKTSSDKTSSDKTTSDKTLSDKTSTDKTSTDKTSTDKTSTDKTSSDKTSSGKTSSDKTTTDKTSSDKTSSGKTSSGKTSSDKTSSDKTTTDKTSSDKISSDKTSSDKTSSDKTTTELTSDKTTSEKISSDKTSSDKTSSDKTTTEKSSSDKTSTQQYSSDKTSTEKSSSDKTSTQQSSSDKTSTQPSSSNKTSTEKSSSDKTSTQPSSSNKTSTEKSSSDKFSAAKTSADKTSPSEPYSSDKTSLKDKTSSKSPDDKSSTEKKQSSGKTVTGTGSSKKGPEYWANLLETVEQQRERELRVIRQRTDSREERDKTPSPMTSLDSVEATYEKLLIVERIPSEEARALAAKGRTGARDKQPRISVVTQEQFEQLSRVVRQLEQKFGPVGSASFPENIQLMQDLRKGASLTDAMAALQLSARLEASEKAMEQMLALVTDLASKTPGIDLNVPAEEDLKVLFGSRDKESVGGVSAKSSILQKSALKSKKDVQESSSEESLNIPLPVPQSVVEQETFAISVEAEEASKEPPDRITYEEMDNAMQELRDSIIKTVNTLTTKSAVNADNAFKIASKLEGKLDASLNLGTKMRDLESLVTNYSEKINILDTSLGSQMTNYQEELTQMQHELETALETMAEVLANAGGDTTAVAELNAHFSNLQSDIDDTVIRQKELRNNQNALAFDLDSLRKQIEILRETKADREEVADALRDKAGLGALNGLVSLQQFDAVRGDMEKRIGVAYEKFNSQETIWQKAIDDLLRYLNEKADWIQVDALKDEMNKYLEILRCRLNAMMQVVGEPKAAAVAKKLHRDATCLSCATPAEMGLEEHAVIPALPAMRPPAIGAEADKPKEDGDHKPCYPGLPIPHPRDPRARVCQRWCGGSHTMVNNTVSRVPPSMIITPAQRQVSTTLGTDGRLYMVDEPIKPCRQCAHVMTPQPSIAEQAQEPDVLDLGSDMTPSDFRASMTATIPPLENETPPFEED